MPGETAKSALIRNLNAILRDKSMSQSELSSRLGMSRQAVHSWINGISYPGSKTIERLASELGVTVDELLSDDIGYAAKPSKQLFRRSIGHGEPAKLPFRHEGFAHAGDPCEPQEYDDTIMVPTDVALAHPDGFALRVEGDCMDRVIPEGYDVVVDPKIEPRNGSVAVVQFDDGDTVMRRWLRGGQTLVLAPDSHSEHDDIVLRWDEGPIKVLGVVVWSQSAVGSE